MIKHRHPSLPLGVALGLVMLPSPWECQAQEAEPGPNTLTVWGQHDTGSVKDKLPPYEEAPDVGVDADLFYRFASSYWLSFTARNLGAQDQSMAMKGGQDGAFTWILQWDQTPFFMGTGTSYYAETSPGYFALPSALKAGQQALWFPTAPAKAPANSSPDYFSLGNALGAFGTQEVDLKTLRRTGKFQIDFTGLENWGFRAIFQQDRKTGNQANTITDGTSILEVAAPINYQTNIVRGEVEYADSRFFANGAAELSSFSDRLHQISVENPMRVADVAGVNQAALLAMPTAPDNAASTVEVSGGVVLPMRHKFVMSLSRSSMRMITDLMPASTNSFLLAAIPNTYTPLPTAFSARMVTKGMTAKLTGDPLPLLGYSATYRHFALDDESELFAEGSDEPGGPVYFKGRGDGTPSTQAGPRDNHSYSRNNLKLEAHTKPIRGLRLGIAYGDDRTGYATRDARSVRDESWTGSADYQYAWFNVHGSYTDLKRKPTYDQDYLDNPPEVTSATVLGVTTGTGTTDTARRNSKLYNALLLLTPIEKASVAISASGVKNDFPETLIGGLTQSKMNNVGFDLTFAPDNRFSFGVGYLYEHFTYDISSQYLPVGFQADGSAAGASPLDQWSNHTDDKVDTFNASVKAVLIPRVLEITSRYDYSKGRSDSGYMVVPGASVIRSSPTAALTPSWQGDGYTFNPYLGTTPVGTVAQAPMYYGMDAAMAGPFLDNPQVVNKTTIWKTQVTYYVRANLSVSGLVWFQKYDRADWATDTMQNYMAYTDPGANRSLFLGTRVLPYDAKVYRVSVGYRF